MSLHHYCTESLYWPQKSQPQNEIIDWNWPKTVESCPKLIRRIYTELFKKIRHVISRSIFFKTVSWQLRKNWQSWFLSKPCFWKSRPPWITIFSFLFFQTLIYVLFLVLCCISHVKPVQYHVLEVWLILIFKSKLILSFRPTLRHVCTFWAFKLILVLKNIQVKKTEPVFHP